MTIEEFKQDKRELKETLSKAIQDFLKKYHCEKLDIDITIETVEHTGVDSYNQKCGVGCLMQYPRIKITTEI